mgnify:FL=1|tara:strand:+ start:2000 stop:2584 length:585 start_codon:yes stop_codon:yes gene_type:complete
MEIILHRINKIKELKTANPRFGIEIDIRTYGNDIILSHDPFKKGDKLKDYLHEYRHGTLILNIKESGIENNVLSLIQRYNNVKSYFLLDVEFPYIFSLSKNNIKNIAIRFSEFESIETVIKFKGIVDWVWIDTFTKLPLNQNSINILKNFKTCLVCPERWNRPGDISFYKKQLKNMKFPVDAVMTSKHLAKLWI